MDFIHATFLALASFAAIAVSVSPADNHFFSFQRDLAYSPPFYPTPWMDPEADGWADAYAKAKDFVSQLTLLEKVNLTTGVGSVDAEIHTAPITNLLRQLGRTAVRWKRGIHTQTGPPKSLPARRARWCPIVRI